MVNFNYVYVFIQPAHVHALYACYSDAFLHALIKYISSTPLRIRVRLVIRSRVTVRLGSGLVLTLRCREFIII